MSNKIDELVNNCTLAPLQENFYQPKNLSDHDTYILANIAKTSIRNIETTKGALVHLLENIKMYQQCMIDAINLESESADLITKYAKSAPKRSYNLPGVISAPSQYNLQNIKSDNERMEQLKNSKEQIKEQKELYMRLMQQDFKIFLESYKRTCYSDSSFEEFLYSLESKINNNY